MTTAKHPRRPRTPALDQLERQLERQRLEAQRERVAPIAGAIVCVHLTRTLGGWSVVVDRGSHIDGALMFDSLWEAAQVAAALERPGAPTVPADDGTGFGQCPECHPNPCTCED